MEDNTITTVEERDKVIKDALEWVGLSFGELYDKAKSNNFDTSKEKLAWIVIHDFLGVVDNTDRLC